MSGWNDLIGRVEDWAEERGILQHSTPAVQLLKTVSELGELADATNKHDRDGIIDGIGDVLVTLVIYSRLQGVTLEECLRAAYETIKDRKGRLTAEGVFVKETDAMLRERERTDHDAAPAAKVPEPEPSAARRRPAGGTGDTQEPVAWGVAAGGGMIATSISRIDAVDMQSDYECDTEVVPLYRSPTLTATQPLHATHGECSLPPECTQPVAWWVTLPGRDFPYLSHIQDRALFCQKDEPGSEVVPLYRSPTLTDEERHAIKVVRGCAVTRAERFLAQSDAEREATMVLWGLLERLG